MLFAFTNYIMLCVADREMMTSKRKMETEASSQRSVIEESRNRITMLENILAKEAVLPHYCRICTLFISDL